MAFVETGLARPNLLTRFVQDHVRVLFFSLGKIGRAPLGTALTALVIGVALALPAGLHVLTRNLASVGHSWQESLQISLFLKEAVSGERGAALTRELATENAVARALYISREAALDEFRAASGFGEALELLRDNPLPAVISVTPQRNLETREVQSLLTRLAALPEVDIARMDQQWLERLHAIRQMGERAVGLIALLLAIAVLIIVGNTIRLDIEARREEIEVMKLIGAPNRFIRRPFLYTGFWFGLGGGLLAWLMVTLGTQALAGPSAELAALYNSDLRLVGLGFKEGLWLVGSGVVLGWIGALLTVGSRLASIEPK